MHIHYNFKRKIALATNKKEFFRFNLIENKNKKPHFLFKNLQLGECQVITKDKWQQEIKYCRFYING